MLKVLEDLVAIQERDRRAAQHRKDLADIPQRQERIRLRLKDRQDAHHKAEEAWKKESAAIKQIEMDTETLKDNIRKFQQQQFEVKSNDQYRALQKEIEAAKSRIRTLEDSELDRMERAEKARAEVTLQHKAVEEEKARVEKECEELGRRGEALAAEVAAIEADRAGRITGVDPVWLSRYERILNHVGDCAIVGVDHGTCGGCHMKLTPQVIHDTRRGDSVTSCTFCGRLLYWHE